MNTSGTKIFAAVCLMMNMEFYYKQKKTNRAWRDREEWAAYALDESIADFTDAELRVLKGYIAELTSGPDAAQRLQQAWEALHPMIFFYR
jgi:hypothetical protein